MWIGMTTTRTTISLLGGILLMDEFRSGVRAHHRRGYQDFNPELHVHRSAAYHLPGHLGAFLRAQAVKGNFKVLTIGPPHARLVGWAIILAVKGKSSAVQCRIAVTL
jgi:hypothetical protein